MQQPTQHIPMNLGQPSGGMDSSAHQGNHSTNALFPNGLPHSSMGNDPLTSALSLLPPELLQSHQHMHQPFGPLASSQPTTSASLLSHVHNQLQPGSQQLLPQQNRGPQGLPQSQQPGPLSDNQHGHHQQQQRQRPQQQRQSSQQAQQQQLPGQQGQQQPSLRPQSNLHLNPQQHPPTSQAQPTPNLAQLLGSNPAALGAQPSLLQQHASILSDARSSVSSFSQSLHEAKQATPSDRGDIRNVVALLERASKALASELDQGVSKLRALSNSPAYNNVAGIFNGAGFGQANTAGHDLFGALNNFGMPGSGLQQQQHNAGGGGMPFDLGLAFPQPPHPNGMFNLNGAANANGPAGSGGGFNAAFSNDVAGPANGQQGPGTQNSPFLSALLAQYLSQSGDPASRMGALSLFQSIANGGTNGPTPNATQGLEALLNQGLPQQQQQQQQQQSRVGISGMDGSRVNHQAAAAQLASGAPLSNAAALAALTSLGITPTMLEALGLGSVAQQMLDAPADATSKQEASGKLAGQMRASPDLREDSPEADQNDASSEPARKKRKQARNKAISSSPHANAEASSSKQPIQPADAKNPSAARPGPPAAIHSAPSKPAIPSHPASNPNLPGSAGPSDASKRIPTLGVGLRQEGDKRYRNRKLLRDLREHLYRWLGTDEFRKLRNTYKVAEWVPNPHLTEEEKQILATLPTGAVAQPPITTHIFHVDFTSRDFYRTNQSLIDAIVTEGSKKVEAKPEAYAIVPGTIDRDHLEDVAKDLMDSARSGFRMSLRTGLQAEKEDKEKHEKYRGVERAKTKCRNREIGAGRLRHAIPKQLLIPGAYSDDAASDEDLHGLTKSEWKRQRLRKLRIAKGWEAVTPKWRNKHLTRAYHKADIVSKSKQMARWRRDDPVDLPIPIKLYGKLLPKQLFDPDWLAEHRKELEDEPYCIRINDNDIEGWDEGHHPLGEDTSDEMEWSDAKESSLHARGRPLMSAASSSRDRGSTTQSPAPGASSNAALKTVDAESKPGSATPQPTTAPASVSKDSPDTVSAVSLAPPEDAPKPASDTNAGSEGSGTSSVSGSSRSGHPDAGSDSDSDSSVPDKTTVPPTTDQAATTSSTDAANSASVAPAKSATAAPEARSES